MTKLAQNVVVKGVIRAGGLLPSALCRARKMLSMPRGGLQAASLTRIMGLIAVAAAVVLPLLVGQFYIRLGIEALLLGGLALSTGILLGFVGLLSLGQVAYFGVGAYISALLFLQATGSFWLVLAAVVICVSALAAVIGAIVIRTRGVYFALISLAFSEVLHKIAFNTVALGGSDGILGIPAPRIGFAGIGQIDLRDDGQFYYFALGVIVVIYFAIRRILATPFGSVLSAIRDNPERVPYLGYNPFWFRLLAYVAAAQVAAVSGMVFPLLRGYVSPDLLSFETTTRSLAMALVGGLSSVLGPLVGGGVITFMDSLVSSLTERHLLVLGLIFVIFVMTCPDGLIGIAARRLTRRERK